MKGRVTWKKVCSTIGKTYEFFSKSCILNVKWVFFVVHCYDEKYRLIKEVLYGIVDIPFFG